MIFLGRDNNGEHVYLDDSRSRAVLICGKRGSGKSYTIGVFLEELVQRNDVLGPNAQLSYHEPTQPRARKYSLGVGTECERGVGAPACAG